LLGCFRCQYHPILLTLFWLKPFWNLYRIDLKSLRNFESDDCRASKDKDLRKRGQSQSYSLLPTNPHLSPALSSIGAVAQLALKGEPVPHKSINNDFIRCPLNQSPRPHSASHMRYPARTTLVWCDNVIAPTRILRYPSTLEQGLTIHPDRP
jgi:hypothetical protein